MPKKSFWMDVAKRVKNSFAALDELDKQLFMFFCWNMGDEYFALCDNLL